MRFDAFASSSAGNAYSVSDGETMILVECGLTLKKLQKAVGFSLNKFSACLVTHCHADHSKCVNELLKMGMPVYMSQGTAEALEISDSVELIENMKQFEIGSIDCVAFEVFHDAPEPMGFLLKSRVDGDIFVFATDTVNLRYKFRGLSLLAIEANFDPAILTRCERMPEKVKRRIENSHMSIDVLCDYLRTMDLSLCREIYLLHLSDSTSHEGHFVNKVKRSVPDHVKVSVCCRG